MSALRATFQVNRMAFFMCRGRMRRRWRPTIARYRPVTSVDSPRCRLRRGGCQNPDAFSAEPQLSEAGDRHRIRGVVGELLLELPARTLSIPHREIRLPDPR